MDIISKIKVLQGERDWTDYRLAQEADLPLTTLSAIFTSRNLPRIDTLQCICNAFGLTLAQFFLDDEKIEMLSDNEKLMLQAFRKLSIKQQKALIDLLNE